MKARLLPQEIVRKTISGTGRAETLMEGSPCFYGAKEAGVYRVEWKWAARGRIEGPQFTEAHYWQGEAMPGEKPLHLDSILHAQCPWVGPDATHLPLEGPTTASSSPGTSLYPVLPRS